MAMRNKDVESTLLLLHNGHPVEPCDMDGHPPYNTCYDPEDNFLKEVFSKLNDNVLQQLNTINHNRKEKIQSLKLTELKRRYVDKQVFMILFKMQQILYQVKHLE